MLRKNFFYACYLLVITALLILALEGTGRLFIHLRYGVPGKSYGLWKYDPELGADYRRHAYNTLASTNDKGFRNLEDVFEPKPADSLRIIAFGGSTTFGLHLEDDETFTHKLELKLRERPGYERTQVLNAGRISFSAGRNLILMKKLVPEFSPDYVILYEGVNEILNAEVLVLDGVNLDDLEGEYGVIGRGHNQNKWLMRNSLIVRFIDYVLRKRIHKLADRFIPGGKKFHLVVHPWVRENYRVVLGEMIDFLRDRGVKLIVVRYASVGNEFHKAFADLSREVAREKKVPVYDMMEDFEVYGSRMAEFFFSTGYHVDSEGAEIVARGLYDAITHDLETT